MLREGKYATGQIIFHMHPSVIKESVYFKPKQEETDKDVLQREGVIANSTLLVSDNPERFI